MSKQMFIWIIMVLQFISFLPIPAFSADNITDEDFSLHSKQGILSIFDSMETIGNILGKPVHLREIPHSEDPSISLWDEIHAFYQDGQIIVSYLRGFLDSIDQITVRSGNWSTPRGIRTGISNTIDVINAYGRNNIRIISDSEMSVVSWKIFNDHIEYPEIEFLFTEEGIVTSIRIIFGTDDFTGYTESELFH